VQLRRAQHLECAADRLRIRVVAAAAGAVRVGCAGAGADARAQGVVLETAHVAHTAGVEVLPEREVVAHVLRYRRSRGGVGCLELVELRVADAVLAVGLAVPYLAVEVEHEAVADRPVVVRLAGQLPVLHGGGGQRHLGVQRQHAAAGGRPVAVAGIEVPAQRTDRRVDGVVADLVLVVDQLLRRVAGNRVDLVAAEADARADALEVGDRDAEVGGDRLLAGGVVRELAVVDVAKVGLGVGGAVADAHAVVGERGVVVVDVEAGLVAAALAAHRHAVAGAEQVALRYRGGQDDARVLRVADAELQAAGGLLLDLDG